MGTSNLDTLIMSPPSDLELSDVDRRKPSKIQDHHHSILSPPTPDTNISHQLTKDQEKYKEDATNSVVSDRLKIRVVTSFSNDDHHPKTPTSREHKIPAMSACPPAPRKVSRSGKRKAPFFVAVGDRYSAADFRVYVDAMLALNEVVYVPDIVVGDLGAGDYAKRLKKTSLADQP